MNVVVIVSLCIFTAMPVLVCPVVERLSRAARMRHARPTRRHKILSGRGRAPTPNSASGDRRKEPSPIPDMAGDRKDMEMLIRYSNKLCMSVLTYCCTCCCCSTTAVVLLYMVDAGGWLTPSFLVDC